MITTVYLAGKMSGITTEEARKWRDEATKSLMDAPGFAVLDPARTTLCPDPTRREIVHSNKYQIRNSDIVLAEINHEEISLGTVGEIIFAQSVGKPVVVWGNAYSIMFHPWVWEHTTKRFVLLEDAVEYIKCNYGKGRRCS